jgi:hypothetical protein
MRRMMKMRPDEDMPEQARDQCSTRAIPRFLQVDRESKKRRQRLNSMNQL